MKKFLTILTVSLFAIFSCKKDSVDPPDNNILGKWYLYKESYKKTYLPKSSWAGTVSSGDSFNPYSKILYLIFQDDGRVKFNVPTANPNDFFQTYSVSGNKLTQGTSTEKIEKLTKSHLVLYHDDIDAFPSHNEFWHYYWRDPLPNCPCKYDEAKKLGNTTGPNGRWSDCGAASQSFHYGATTEVRWLPDDSGAPGQQCTYDVSGSLITGGLAAGSFDSVSPGDCGYGEVANQAGIYLLCDLSEHCIKDVQPWLAGNPSTVPCWQYMGGWPANRGINCQPNVINGFSHMTKMVGDMSCEEIKILIKAAADPSNYLVDSDLRKFILGTPTSLTNDQVKLKMNTWKLGLCGGGGSSAMCKILDTAIKNL